MQRTLLLLGLLASAAAARDNIPKLVRKVEPAVVTVRTYDASGNLLIQGSGFFVDKSGHVVTSRHVVTGAAKVQVTVDSGAVYPAGRVVAEDQAADIAMIQVEAPKAVWRTLGVRRAVPQVGETVLVVGSPLGFEHSVSDGIVSAVRDVPGMGLVLQITAPMSAGSSGSPVINLKGEVVGVARSQRQEGQNVNFAVPGGRISALWAGVARSTTGDDLGKPVGLSY
jgi:S1-C subfamily serine protease